MYVGYAQVSTQDQSFSLQVDTLHAGGCAADEVRSARGQPDAWGHHVLVRRSGGDRCVRT